MAGEGLHVLKRIDARETWGHEARDFTPWLELHIDRLNEALGFEIEITGREGDVGSFSVDLWGKDVQTGNLVIIENQLEPTDHSHMGQLLTYAAGKKAKMILWISPKFRDEHRQALQWLNEMTPEDIGFFGVELEVLEINGQRAANFKLVAEPNSWQKQLSNASSDSGTSERMTRYQTFYADLLGRLKKELPTATSAARTQPQSWFSFAAGAQGCLFAWAFKADGRFATELEIATTDPGRNRRALDRLRQRMSAGLPGVPESLSWDVSDTRRAQRVDVFAPGHSSGLDSTPDELEALKVWGVQRMKAFVEAWRPLLTQALGEQETVGLLGGTTPSE